MSDDCHFTVRQTQQSYHQLLLAGRRRAWRRCVRVSVYVSDAPMTNPPVAVSALFQSHVALSPAKVRTPNSWNTIMLGAVSGL